MILERKWAQNISVDNSWSSAAKIAPHRLYQIWDNKFFFPCDDFGLRIPNHYNNIREKYEKSSKNYKIFCFGGSTTFGFYLPYNESYPHYLETLYSKTSIFNIGICGSDVTQSLYMYIDLLRIGLIPDMVVFLDGINEKQGYIQARTGNINYNLQSNSYEMINNAYQGSQNKNLLNRAQKYIFNKFDKSKVSEKQNLLKFVKNQSVEYVLSVEMIKKISSINNVECLFILQPTVWDTLSHDYLLDNEELNRKAYLKKLYEEIILHDNKIFTLNKNTIKKLKPDMFFDWQHLTKDGNKILAKIVKDFLRDVKNIK